MPVVDAVESYANDPGRCISVWPYLESRLPLHDETEFRLASSNEGTRMTATAGTVFQGGLQYEFLGLDPVIIECPQMGLTWLN